MVPQSGRTEVFDFHHPTYPKLTLKNTFILESDSQAYHANPIEILKLYNRLLC